MVLPRAVFAAVVLCAAASLAAAASSVPQPGHITPQLRAAFGRPSLYATFAASRVVTYNGVPDDDSLSTEQANGALMNKTLASLRSGDMLVIPNRTYHVMGGIQASNLQNVTIAFRGSLVYSKSMKAWPRSGPGSKARVLECMEFINCRNLRLVGNDGGSLLEGNGAVWWGFPGIGYLLIGENRPRMLTMDTCTDCLVENLYFHQSPYWTFWAPNSNGLEVRTSSIDNRRDSDDGHDIIDLTAFNTDGFDITGTDVWIHDVSVWNQDDCVAVKDGSQNMLIERVTASGLGMTIGSIASTVRNITFRDVVMPHTYKGIYMKFRGAGLVEDVLYENITMQSVEQAAIWIGPAQQSDSDNLCAAHPCSICWPLLKALGAECNAPASALYRNITLRNIFVDGSKQSPGVILANSTSAMQDITFDNVVVRNAGTEPFGSNYYCEGVASGKAIGGTTPVPPCFDDLTNRH